MSISIGNKQLGRLQATSVINYEPIEKEIRRAREKLDFMSNLAATKSPYGEGGASIQILRILRRASIDGILGKSFYDLQ